MSHAPDYLISSYLERDIGSRKDNQDWVAFFEPEAPADRRTSGCLFIVADGVGGASEGAKASQYAAQKVLHLFYQDDDPDLGARLQRALQQAGNEIHDYSQRGDRPKRMGTTMVAAAIRMGRLTVANVGDSRAYLIRGGYAEQLTRDHSLVGERVARGELTEEEALDASGRNELTRSLGGEYDVPVDIFADIPLQPGDRLLLCTDGLARYATTSDITTLTTKGTPEEICGRCIDYAYDNGADDNIGIAVVEVGRRAFDMEETRRAPRAVVGPLPQQVKGFAEFETDPDYHSRRRRPLKRKKARPSRWLVLGVLIAIGLIVGGFMFVVGRGYPGTISSADFATEKPTSDTATQNLTTGEESIGILPPTDMPTLPSLPQSPTVTSSTLTPIALATLTQPVNLTPTTGVRPDIVWWDESQMICIYVTQAGDGVLVIQRRFHLANPDQGFDVYTQAELENNSALLSYANGDVIATKPLWQGEELHIRFISEPRFCKIN